MLLIKIIQVIVFGFGIYYLLVAMAGLFTRQPRYPANSRPEKRFAVIIPAHNEARVLPRLIENLKELDYPRHLYDIHVIADHCQDDTARIARKLGAIVWERQNGSRGKGRSLREVIDALGFNPRCRKAVARTRYSGPRSYDAAVIIDADNLVAPNFLEVMNKRLLAGEKLIQCFIDSKNPDDNWVTSIFTLNFWLNNRFILQARYNLGLSSLTAGTGVCIAREVFEKTGGWSTVTITEDLEFAVQALWHGFRATFARETRVYDEKPVTFYDACQQRLRWARGQLNVAFMYVPRLLARGIIERDPARLEGGIRLLQIPMVAVGSLMALLAWPLPAFFRETSLYFRLGEQYPLVAATLAAVPYLLPLLTVLLDRLPLKPCRYFAMYPIFYLSWGALLLYALFTFRRQIWVPSNHTRALDHRTLFQRSGYNPAVTERFAPLGRRHSSLGGSARW
ncbi:MAG: glycosyltransferase family 2 protein [Dethiobacteria bacterium]|nr:glycosyltransferase family 2 protein [Bacillota bacterium]HPT34141.1 glycosyltransferase family 2 protein [Bacillota bacterium]HPZ64028.1 glycosyltransferase family 2 protein [Bacillota bacterium]HQD06086.1 glycosyltransferase family 2 protein [Bacillota bacterium]